MAARFRATPTCLGLDLGSHSIKGVVLQKTGPSAVAVLGAAVVPLAPETDAAATTHALHRLLDTLGARATPVVAAVGGPGTILRTVLLPKMSPQELKTALTFEAEKYIPFKLSEVYLDSVVVGDRPEGRMDVLLAAARKELVEQVVVTLAAAGIAPRLLDLETAALANAWELSPQGPPPTNAGPAPTGAVGLLHVGARGTIVVVMAGTHLQFTREIPVGGDVFTQAVAAALGLEPGAAETVKCHPGDRAADVQSALAPAWDEWLRQCRGSFDFYENAFGRGVDRVVLSGGAARMTGLAARVQEAWGWPTEVWNPLAGVGTVPMSADDAVSLGIAVGLARRGLVG